MNIESSMDVVYLQWRLQYCFINWVLSYSQRINPL